jgi:hypothetical protein
MNSHQRRIRVIELSMAPQQVVIGVAQECIAGE